MNKMSGFWFSPSYKCNNRCLWCYVGGLLKEAPEASLIDSKKYINKMVSFGAKRCILIGGEPSVYPHILDVISYATFKGLDVRMMSNGRRLSSYSFVLELKKAGLKYCSISLEGPEEIHDKTTRVKGSFKESFKAIKNCKEAGLPVNSITTVSLFNKDYLVDFLETLKEIKIRKAVFNMCSSQPSGYDGQNRAIINLSDYARIVEDIGARYDFVCFYALIPLCLFDQGKLESLLTSGKLRVSCSLLGFAVAIDPKGFLLPCNHMADINYGNINSPGILPKVLKHKEKEVDFLSTHAPSEKCINCHLWNTCKGGCSLIWFSRNAEENIPGLKKERR